MGSKAGNILKIAAPIALGFIPGLQPLAAAAIGAGIGAVGGGGLKGALMGAAGGYLGAGGLTSTATGGLGGTAIGKAASSIGNSFSNLLGGGSAGGAMIPGQVVTLGAAGADGINWAPMGQSITSAASSGGGGLASMLGNVSGTQLLGAAGNIYSGIQGTQAAKDMAKAQLSANDKALALQSKIYDQTSANMSPFMTTGQAANTQLSSLLGLQGDPNASGYGSLTKKFTMDDFQADPGYQFRLAEGTKAMNQSLGAKGSLFSGEALKAGQDFGQNLANQTYNDAYTRYVQDQNNTYSKLNTTAAAGQNAAAQQGASGASYANNAGQLLSNVGDINANKINTASNATNQGLAGLIGGNYGFAGGTGSSYQTGVGSQANQIPVYDVSGKIIGYRAA